jgi:hypothetical protein
MSDEFSIDTPDAAKSGTIGRLVRRILPWIITVLIFVYIFRQVPISDVRDALELVQLKLFVPLVVAVYMLAGLACLPRVLGDLNRVGVDPPRGDVGVAGRGM